MVRGYSSRPPHSVLGSYIESLPPEIVEIEIQMEPIEVKFLGETRITRSEFSQ